MNKGTPLSLAAFALAALTLIFPFKAESEESELYTITPDSIRQHHKALVGISAKAGGLEAGIRLNDAGQKAADYLFRFYKEAGLQNVRFEEFYPTRWWPDNYEITVLGDGQNSDKKITAFPLWYCKGAKDIELEVVYVGFGSPKEWVGKDVKGKAVLIDMKRILHFIPSYNNTNAKELAVKNGAAALLIAETRIDSPSGNRIGIGGPIKDQKGGKIELCPVPTFSIGKRDREYLLERIQSGQTKIKINLDVSIEEGRAVNVVGEIPGNGEIDEYIIVGGHYDTWFTGAIDNLGSQAAMIEMAKYFTSMPLAVRNRHIIFVSLFGHELRNAAMGHAAFVEKHVDIQDRVTCFLDIDGSGSYGYEEKDDTGEILPTGMDDKAGIFFTCLPLHAIAQEAIHGRAKGPWFAYPPNVLVADLGGPIQKAGYPCLLIISKHIYYHSLLDTLDRITPDQVYRRTLMNVHIVQRLLDSPESFIIDADTNPYRKRQDPGITDVSLHVIPHEPLAGNPIIVWPAMLKSGFVIQYGDFSWDFGDSSPAVKSMMTEHTYKKPGTYIITLTITDGTGRKGASKRTIEIK